VRGRHFLFRGEWQTEKERRDNVAGTRAGAPGKESASETKKGSEMESLTVGTGAHNLLLLELSYSLSPPPYSLTLPSFTVGYALTSKKTKSFIQPKLEEYARLKNIVFTAIDHSLPLTDQGPFDVLLHKFTGKEWRQSLEDYKRKYPDVIVLDPPEAILQLRNRQSMLQDVAELDMSSSGGFVGVPRQLVVTGDATSIPASVSAAGLKLPLVAKPLVSDGSAKAHEMSLAYEKSCLNQLDPPLMLQEFVNHGGVLFKTYVVGDHVRVVRRLSLPDVTEGQTFGNGVMPFPRVSCATESAENADLDPQAAALPPRELLESLSKELRRRLGLTLFNMDIIREKGGGNRYYVIDINYFPGFGKMPDYEEVFTQFFSDLALDKSLRKTRVSSSDVSADPDT